MPSAATAARLPLLFAAGFLPVSMDATGAVVCAWTAPDGRVLKRLRVDAAGGVRTA